MGNAFSTPPSPPDVELIPPRIPSRPEPATAWRMHPRPDPVARSLLGDGSFPVRAISVALRLPNTVHGGPSALGTFSASTAPDQNAGAGRAVGRKGEGSPPPIPDVDRPILLASSWGSAATPGAASAAGAASATGTLSFWHSSDVRGGGGATVTSSVTGADDGSVTVTMCPRAKRWAAIAAARFGMNAGPGHAHGGDGDGPSVGIGAGVSVGDRDTDPAVVAASFEGHPDAGLAGLTPVISLSLPRAGASLVARGTLSSWDLAAGMTIARGGGSARGGGDAAEDSTEAALTVSSTGALRASLAQSFTIRRSVLNPLEPGHVRTIRCPVRIGTAFTRTRGRGELEVAGEIQANRGVLVRARAGPRGLAGAVVVRSWTRPALTVAVAAEVDPRAVVRSRSAHAPSIGAEITLDSDPDPVAYSSRPLRPRITAETLRGVL